MQADTGDHSCSAQSGHDWAVSKSKYSIAAAGASHSVVTSPAAMLSTAKWAEQERTLVVVFLSAAAAAAVLLVLAVTTLAVVLCICSACTAVSPRRPVRPCELTLVTTHAARSRVMIGQSALTIQHCSSRSITQRGDKPCLDDEHRKMGRERAYSCRHVSCRRRCGRRTSRPCSNHPCNRPLHILSRYICIALEACAIIRADTGDHSCSAQS